jgi:hypothetical protein
MFFDNDTGDNESKDKGSHPDEPKEAEYKKPREGAKGKKGATDIPSWAKGQSPKKGESGKDFARRLMDQKYGKGNWSREDGQGREYSQLKKYGDRHFQ